MGKGYFAGEAIHYPMSNGWLRVGGQVAHQNGRVARSTRTIQGRPTKLLWLNAHRYCMVTAKIIADDLKAGNNACLLNGFLRKFIHEHSSRRLVRCRHGRKRQIKPPGRF